MSWQGASFYGCSSTFCIDCRHYVGGKTSRDDVCGLSGLKCSRARMNGSEHDCGPDGQYFTPKEPRDG